MTFDVLEDVAWYIQDHGLGTIGKDLFIGHMPPMPDEATAIKPGGGTPVDHHSAGSWPLVDFDCRAQTPEKAIENVQAILRIFTDLHDLVIRENHYVRIQSYYPGPQQFYSWDDMGRATWSGTLKINMRPLYTAL